MENERLALLSAILDTAVDAIILIDGRGIIIEVNPATEQLFGFRPDELVGNNVNVLMPSPFHEEHDQYLQRYQETGVAKIIGIGREVTGQRKDKTTFPMHLAVSEINAGERRLFAGIVRDITDLKDAELELKRLNELLEERVRARTAELREAQSELLRKEKLATLGQVFGGIAHEIRNPLNAVKTSAYYLLNAKTPSHEKRLEHLERIDRQVTMIDNVVTALSDVARLPEPETKPTDIAAVVREVIGSVSMSSNITVVNELDSANLPGVLVDPNQIPIVFRNLVSNARDAMPDGGVLTVGGEAHADHVVIRVSDTGMGIREDQLDKILEPLFSTKARGMGLGLPISLAILEKNHGKLEVRSEVGEGTTFSLTLPTRATDSTQSDD